MEDLNTKLLLEKIQDGVIVYDSNSVVIFVNSSALDILKMQKQELIDKSFDDINWTLLNASGDKLKKEHYPAHTVALKDDNIINRIIGLTNENIEEPIWMLTNAYRDNNNVVVTFSDVTHRYTHAFHDIVEHAIDGVIITKADNIDKPNGPEIIYVNDHLIELTGYVKEELVGNTPRIFQGYDTSEESISKIRKALEKKSPIREVMLNYKKSGDVYWVDMSIFPLSLAPDDSVTHFCSIQKDITEIKKSEIESVEDAQKDPLTGLLNRRGLKKEYANFTKTQSFSVIMIDVDHFKKINDDFSHLHGDKVLISLANIIEEYSRSDDLAVRFGGEEFIIFLPDTNKNDAKNVAERIRLKVQEQKLIIDDQSIDYTISCGIAANDNLSVNQTIKAADKALYQAKSQGRNRSVVFS
ncbi:sensor domain-containing diguanylate cyclase [Francisella sp. SYW-9]|uniref:sensor domain-containing diguanylate cyclase n=1 Tax=Francisella sp. SYW-9 TaxID=2610888 RepID=UPI00123C9C97|nr:sensor domain-containing diguanylate cyclase [Francisella sp. SYW-9]